MEAGCDDYDTKPVELARLLAKMALLGVERDVTPDEAPRAAARAAHAAEPPHRLHRDAARGRRRDERRPSARGPGGGSWLAARQVLELINAALGDGACRPSGRATSRASSTDLQRARAALDRRCDRPPCRRPTSVDPPRADRGDPRGCAAGSTGRTGGSVLGGSDQPRRSGAPTPGRPGGSERSWWWMTTRPTATCSAAVCRSSGYGDRSGRRRRRGARAARPRPARPRAARRDDAATSTASPCWSATATTRPFGTSR